MEHPQLFSMSSLRNLLVNISEQFYAYNSSISFNLEGMTPSSFSTSALYDIRHLNINLTNILSNYSDSLFNKLDSFILQSTSSAVPSSGLSSSYLPRLKISLVNENLIQATEYFLSLILIFVLLLFINRTFIKSRLCTEILETILGILIFLPVMPPLFLFTLSVLTMRWILSSYLKYLNTNYSYKLSLVSPVDAFWAYECHASTSTSLGLYIIEGNCDLEKIRQRIQTTMDSDVVGGKMNRKLTSMWNFPCWELLDKSQINIQDHVKLILDDGNIISSEKDIFKFIEGIQDHPIVGKPPWEVFVVPRFSYGDNNTRMECYAMIFRIHHAIMDGISTANILHSVLADKPFKFSIDPIQPLGSKRAPNVMETALVYLLAFISLPRVSLRNLMLVDNHQNKFCLPGKRIKGPKSLDWSRPIDLNMLKKIKNVTGSSVYAVLLSCLGGAFRQFYKKNGEEIECDHFHVMSPIALLPYPDRMPRNRFTAVFVPTSVGAKDLSPLERLHLNYKNLQDLGSTSASYHLTVSNWYFPAFVGLLPLCLHGLLSSTMHLKMALSNVPGPAEDVWINGGDKIVDVGIWLPIKYSLGLGMGLFSYKDRVRATIIGDKTYYPHESDIQVLMNGFEQELQYLAHSVGLKDIFLE